jgi:hypothetical protein
MSEIPEQDRQDQGAAADISMLSPEQIGTYTRAFIERRGDYLIVDGWSLRQHAWQREDIAQLAPLGLLVEDPSTSEECSDEQYTAVCYRPSPGFLAALRAQRDAQ